MLEQSCTTNVRYFTYENDRLQPCPQRSMFIFSCWTLIATYDDIHEAQISGDWADRCRIFFLRRRAYNRIDQCVRHSELQGNPLNCINKVRIQHQFGRSNSHLHTNHNDAQLREDNICIGLYPHHTVARLNRAGDSRRLTERINKDLTIIILNKPW